jgi:hypothetical protein
MLRFDLPGAGFAFQPEGMRHGVHCGLMRSRGLDESVALLDASKQ